MVSYIDYYIFYDTLREKEMNKMSILFEHVTTSFHVVFVDKIDVLSSNVEWEGA